MSHGFARHGLAVTPPSGAGGAWVRPSDWLALTTPDISEQKIVGLHAVLPGNNWVAFTLSGAYTVDWGDGNTENFAAGATAYRNLAWSSYDTSTLTTRGYRQAIITITPQSGHNITSWNFLVKHNQPGLSNGYSTGWLDMRLCTPHVASCTFSGSAGQVWHRMIEKFEQVGTNTVTSASYMFYGCSSLQSVTLDTGAVTSASYMFYGCSSLQSVVLDTGAVTNAYQMFYVCSSLQSVTLDTGAVTSASQMFYNCSSLQSVTLDTGAVVDASYMFYNCSSLQSVTLDTGAVTSAYSMFNGCSSLQSVVLDTGAVVDASYMFNGCPSLQSVILTGLTRGVSVANASLSSTALDALYTSLGTAAGSQTITVSGNYGTTGDDPSIATSKGWTVSGS